MRTVRVFVRSDAAQLPELVARVDAGDLRIDVAGRRTPADLPAVHDEAAAGRLAGKTVPTSWPIRERNGGAFLMHLSCTWR
ncbi:hypothetical protein [Nonomuraea sp. NPDC049709]|uniref:hypothetical protein n=1 Tax=Nonomuraea sp. NPDC049709 TaxID=3154736 RepID=UPI00342990FC